MSAHRVLYLIDDLNLLLKHYCSQLTTTSLSAKIHVSYVKCGHDHASEQLALSFQSDSWTRLFHIFEWNFEHDDLGWVSPTNQKLLLHLSSGIPRISNQNNQSRPIRLCLECHFHYGVVYWYTGTYIKTNGTHRQWKEHN